jgi:molybdate/tungstate transport system substrate-binding protein
LIVYSADSYVAESASLGSAFASETGSQYASPTSGGSFTIARQIAQGAPVDVFISVSAAAIGPSYLGDRAPGWAIGFASDQMVIAYGGTPTGNVAKVVALFDRASSLNSSKDYANAFGNLTSGVVKVGISDANADPAGLRAWLVLEMAGQAYTGSERTYSADIVANRGNVTGANAAALASPLESGTIQFLFIYKSAAIAHGLNYVALPRQVNLGDPNLAEHYSKFAYQLSTGLATGSPIILYVTVPRNPVQPSQALAFVAYVVQHSSSLGSFGLTPFTPARLYNSTSVPPEIGQLVRSGAVEDAGTI